MEQENLFESFSPISKQEWIAKATTDLRGADFDEKLVWKTAEGLDIMPFYTQEDLAKLTTLEGQQNGVFQPEKSHLGARDWENRQLVVVADEKKANAAALHALNQGASGIVFDLSNKNQYNFELLLNEILFPYCSVSFKIKAEYKAFFSDLSAYLATNELKSADLQGSLTLINASTENVYDAVLAAKDYPNFRCVTIEHDAHEEVTNKIASLLVNTAKTVEALLGKSLSAEAIFSKLEVVYRLGNNYFFELASLRAIRSLLAGMAKAYGLADFKAHQVHIQAETSIVVSEETQANPEWNMLSNTNQAMAAIIGGCNSISILPHNLGIKPDAAQDSFATRIARNISTILREEAYFDKVVDPAAGSYYIEQLTQQLAEKAWKQFQEQL